MTATVKTSTDTDDLDVLAARLETLSSFEGRVWDGAPEVIAAHQRVARMNSAAAELAGAFGGSSSVELLVSTALDALLDGAALDAETLRRSVADTVAAAAVSESVQRTVGVRSVTVRSDVDSAEQQHADSALGVMNTTVRELVSVSRALFQLADQPVSVANAVPVAQAGALLSVAIDVHDRLRTAQMRLTRSPAFDGPSVVRLHGIVEDPSSLAPFANWLAFGAEGATDAVALPDIVNTGGIELLRLVCRHDLTAWVPTMPQLTAAADAMRLRVEQARYRKRNPDAAPVRDTRNDVRPTISPELVAGRSLPAKTVR